MRSRSEEVPGRQSRMQRCCQGTGGMLKQIDDLKGMRIVGKIGSCSQSLNLRFWSWDSFQ